MLSSGLAALMLPQLGWRGVFVVATFPLIVILILRFGLRESPYFLKIQHLRRLKAQGETVACDRLAKQWSLDIAGDRPNTYAELFTPALRRQSIALGAMFFFKIIADSQLTVLATSVLGQAKGIDLTSALWTIFFGNGVAVLGYLLLGWLGDRIGRRETVIIAQTLAAVCTFALLFVTTSLATVVIGYALVLFFAQGAAAPFFAYVGESFPPGCADRARPSSTSRVRSAAFSGPLSMARSSRPERAPQSRPLQAASPLSLPRPACWPPGPSVRARN